MNNTDNLQRFEIALRSGWKDEEKLMLWDEVKSAHQHGVPLKRVFETVAEKTGRKPNSVRNYYYMKVKEAGEITQKPSSFVPFTKEEIYVLLRTLLAAGVKGQSVRGASLKMANGDKKLMLRYQNKYRSLLKSGRALVERVMADMDAEGERYINPYDKPERMSQLSTERMYISESVAKALMAADIDIKGFFRGLSKLASLAESGIKMRGEMQMTAAQNESIKRENESLVQRNRELKARIEKETERLVSAKTLLKKLVGMSTDASDSLPAGLSAIGELLGENASLGADAL